MDGGLECGDVRSIIKIAAIIAMVIAVALAGFMFIYTEKQHTSLYITPESYQNQTQSDRIVFTYGVICSEKEVTDYEIRIFLNNVLLTADQIRMNDDERYEKNEELLLTEDVSSPAKIEVLLTNKNTMDTEAVHFWIEIGNETTSYME